MAATIIIGSAEKLILRRSGSFSGNAALCRRDFIWDSKPRTWRAVHVGLVRVRLPQRDGCKNHRLISGMKKEQSPILEIPPVMNVRDVSDYLQVNRSTI